MKIHTTDVLVIGSGGAGLRAAIALHDKGIKTTVVGKCKKRDAHTTWARGGINSSLGTMDPKDSWQLHAADTIKDGGFLNDPQAVSILCKNATNAVLEVNEWGAKFHKEKDGRLSQRFFGAATYRRASFIGDHTGLGILNTLVDQVNKRKDISFMSEIYILHLLKNGNSVNGALGLDMKTGSLIVFHAKAVILATGGHSKMFKRSSSRFYENNGDGIFLGAEVGCSLMDMELFQFHPTGMVYPKAAEGLLATEAIRGEGGRLFNNKKERFMKKYDPKRMELSARDIVAQSIFYEIKAGRGTKNGGVYLDISHKPAAYIKKRLPTMYRQFLAHGNVDITKKPMEVAPTAHYSMGGLVIDHKTGKTDVSDLYAIGEVTSGVHGGNRLGGNSLAEILVFGKITGEYVAKQYAKKKLIPLDVNYIQEKEQEFTALLSSSGKNATVAKREITQVMWKSCGLIRSEEGLTKGLNDLETYKTLPLKTGKNLAKNELLIDRLDVRNMILTCELILKSARMRKESRRAHLRSDYPKERKQWHKNIVCVPKKNGGFKLTTKEVSPIPKQIEKHFTHKRSEHMLE